MFERLLPLKSTLKYKNVYVQRNCTWSQDTFVTCTKTDI